MSEDVLTATAEDDFKDFVDPEPIPSTIQQLPALDPKRCTNCGKLLFKGHVGDNGNVQAKCGRCGTVNTFKPNSPPANFQDRMYINRKRRYR